MSQPDDLPPEIARIFEAKREWHRRQAALPLREKVRILLELQRQDYPLLKERGVLRPWERPWDIEP
jgi:hypothetical protein